MYRSYRRIPEGTPWNIMRINSMRADIFSTDATWFAMTMRARSKAPTRRFLSLISNSGRESAKSVSLPEIPWAKLSPFRPRFPSDPSDCETWSLLLSRRISGRSGRCAVTSATSRAPRQKRWCSASSARRRRGRLQQATEGVGTGHKIPLSSKRSSRGMRLLRRKELPSRRSVSPLPSRHRG